MDSVKIIMNVFYKPVQELRDIIESDAGRVYLPVNGGASLRGDEWCDRWLRYDDTGDNISSKNGLLNEMTSIYWAWKNAPEPAEAKYVGFCHYRRFFRQDAIGAAYKHDITVGAPVFPCNMSLRAQYGRYHVTADLNRCLETLSYMDPVFWAGFSEYLDKSCVNYAPCNMFIMRRRLFDEWCKFIFRLFDELYDKIDVSGRDNYQRRAMCFLCERVFGYWVWSKRGSLAVAEAPLDERLEYKDNSLNERGTYGNA